MDNSNLLQLIKSLKKSEKRYIALYLSRQKENHNLLKLFSIISSRPSITDAEIPEIITDKSILSRLFQNKYALYNLLLDTLHQLDLRKSPYARIVTMLHQSEILLNKGLTEARMELLIKAEKIADQYELLTLKLEIIRLRNVDKTEEEFLKKTQQVLDKIINNAKLKHLDDRITRFQLKLGNRLTATQKKYCGKILAAFKKKSVKQDSFYSKYIYFSFLMMYYKATGEFNERYNAGTKMYKLFKQYPDMLHIQMWRLLYCSKLNDLFISAYRASTNKTIELIYNEIRNVDSSNTYKKYLNVNMMDSYIQIGEFKKGEKFLNDIQDRQPLGLTSRDALLLYVNLALMNFGLENYTKALFWLNEILNNSTKKLSDFPYIGITRLIRLITYYELKKLDVLEYEIHSTSKYITKHESFFKMDQLVLHYLQKMILITNRAELKKVMEDALDKLLKLSKIKSEAATLDFFDFISWFESKIENKSFGEVVKKRIMA